MRNYDVISSTFHVNVFRQLINILRFLCFVATVFVAIDTPAESLIGGVNIVNPMRASAFERDMIVHELAVSGVRIVRFELEPDDQSIRFAKALFQCGIRIDLIVQPQYPLGAPTRAYDPKRFPKIWRGHPLSSADEALSKGYFEKLIGMLDANGIVLAALELGNEINTTAFNAEFGVPGKGRIFGLDDLYHDPQGKVIAKGFIKYLEVLNALKKVRNRSMFNAHTPIISAGLAPTGAPGRNPNSKTDNVSIDATIQFLRAHGLDGQVDAYGIHFYPKTISSMPSLKNEFETYDVSQCRSATFRNRKPCWITEWGIVNNDKSCSPSEVENTSAVNEIMAEFFDLASQGRIVGILYFSWNTEPTSKEDDSYSIFRCGRLTDMGKTVVNMFESAN